MNGSQAKEIKNKVMCGMKIIKYVLHIYFFFSKSLCVTIFMTMFGLQCEKQQ
jgi:hypothetical protein